MKYVVYFAIGWCVVWGFAGEAMAYDGNDLLGYCKKSLNGITADLTTEQTLEWMMGNGLCMGYITGVSETYLMQQQALTQEQDFCLTEGIAIQKLMRVVTNYLEARPTELHKNASILIQAALIDAFPCKGGE